MAYLSAAVVSASGTARSFVFAIVVGLRQTVSLSAATAAAAMTIGVSYPGCGINPIQPLARAPSRPFQTLALHQSAAVTVLVVV